MITELEAIKYLNDTCINFLDRTKELYCTVTFTRKRAEILRDNIDTIKQALLKEQEPKKYLTWDDLEFTKDLKCQKVKMNDNDYRIRYILDDFGGKCCFLYDSTRNHYIILNKQFFNDLRLERVEE